MKKLFIFALLAIGITGTGVSFAQEKKAEKKENKMEKKEDKGKMKKADKKDNKMDKKEEKKKEFQISIKRG